MEKGYSFAWEDGKMPKLTGRDGKNVPLEVHSHVPMLKNDSAQAFSVQEATVEGPELTVQGGEGLRETSVSPTPKESRETFVAPVSETIVGSLEDALPATSSSKPQNAIRTIFGTSMELDEIIEGRRKGCEKTRLIIAQSMAVKRRIEDYEVLQCLQVWGFKKNANRSNVRPDGAD